MSFDRIKGWPIGFALLMLVLASSAASLFVQPETYMGLASFREIWTGEPSASQASFAYTPMHERIFDPNRSMGKLYYTFMIVSGWGTSGLLVLKYLVCFGIAIAVHGLSVRQGIGLPVFAALAILALALATLLGVGDVRPSLVSGAALVGLFHLLWADRHLGGYWLWGTAPLIAVWSTFHEGAVLGLIILSIHCLSRMAQQYRDARSRKFESDRDQYLWLVLLTSIAGMLIMPGSGKLILYFFILVFESGSLAMDSQPLWHTQSMLTQVLFLTTIFVAGIGVHMSKPWPVFESIVLFLTGVFALNYPGFEIIYVVSWICLVPPLIKTTRAGIVIENKFLRNGFQVCSVSVALGLVGLGFAIQNRFWEFRLISQPTADARNQPIYPIAATDFLASNKFSGNLLVPESAGGYVAWRLFPEVKISADSRLHLAYPKETLEMNRRFFSAVVGWPNLISESTDALLIPVHEPVFLELSRAIESRNLDWQQVYRDSGYAIFVREGIEVAQRPHNSNSEETIDLQQH